MKQSTRTAQIVGSVLLSFVLVFGGMPVASAQEEQGDPNPPGTEAATDTTVPLIIGGTPVEPNGSGFVKAGGCSGTLLTNEWALVSRQCTNTESLENPSSFTVEMGDQSSTALLVEPNPSAGSPGVLVRLASPFMMNGSRSGYWQPIWRGKDIDLVGNTLACYGYGYNISGGGYGTLRQALLTVSPDEGRCGEGCYVVKPNTSGQGLAPGDAGAPCLLDRAGVKEMTGLTWGTTDQLSATLFRGWVYNQIHRNGIGSAMTAGDFNGDGFQDLAIGEPGASTAFIRSWSGQVAIYRGGPRGYQLSQLLTQAPLGTQESGDQFGYSLSSGDYNGDGFDDLAVAAPSEDLTGVVYVYKGRRDELSATQILDQSELDVNQANSRFGSALATGDFDGDGKPDLAVGAPGKQTGGRIFSFKGHTDGLLPWQMLDQTAIGSNEGTDRLGFSLVAGDFNGDGRDDLAASAPGEAQGSDPVSGYVFLYRGAVASLEAWTGLGQETGGLDTNEGVDLFGWALAAGDLNGDGREELVVGAPQDLSSNRSGSVFIYQGTDTEPVPAQVVRQEPFGSSEVGDWFGASLAIADFNGDGNEDLAVGAPAEVWGEGAAPESGYVYLFLGNSTGDLLMQWEGVSQDQIAVAADGDWYGGAILAFTPSAGAPPSLAIGSPGKDRGKVFVTDIDATVSTQPTYTTHMLVPPEFRHFLPFSLTE